MFMTKSREDQIKKVVWLKWIQEPVNYIVSVGQLHFQYIDDKCLEKHLNNLFLPKRLLPIY